MKGHHWADIIVMTVAGEIIVIIVMNVRWNYDEKQDMWIVSKYLPVGYLFFTKRKRLFYGEDHHKVIMVNTTSNKDMKTCATKYALRRYNITSVLFLPKVHMTPV